MDKTGLDDTLRSIRKEFFAFRNGMIADTLKKGGLGQKYIFGLQLPQIKDIAVRFKPDNEEDAASLARALWSDKECRETRLLACHLMPPDFMSYDEAEEWAGNVATREEADILAFRLLRHLPYAGDLARALYETDDQLKQYTSTAIRRFL